MAIVSVAELSTRISTKGYLTHRANEVRRTLVEEVTRERAIIVGGGLLASGGGLNAQTGGANSSIQTPLSDVSRRLDRYDRLAEKIAFLEFAGTTDFALTGNGLRDELQNFEGEIQRLSEIESINREISSLSIRLSSMKSGEILMKESQSIVREIEESKIEIDPPMNETIRKIANIHSRIKDISSIYGYIGFRLNQYETLDEIYMKVGPNADREPDTGSKYIRNYLFAASSWLNSLETRVAAEIDDTQARLSFNERRLKDLQAAQTDRSSATGGDPLSAHWLGWTGPFSKLVLLPSDVLLALSVVCCGGIGAAVAGVRQHRGRSSEDRATESKSSPVVGLFLGMAAGFIAFLFIKGGKFLFIVQGAEVSIPINPYGSAFAGVLAGLFTERAYQVLSSVVDAATDRFAKDQGSQDHKAGKSPPEDQPPGDQPPDGPNADVAPPGDEGGQRVVGFGVTPRPAGT